MIAEDFILKNYNSNVESGSVKWESPSNIALVKYWGKKENQIPENPSISFTLSNCKTITKLTYTKKESKNFSFDVYFEGEQNEAFKPKIQTFFETMPTLKHEVEVINPKTNVTSTLTLQGMTAFF